MQPPGGAHRAPLGQGQQPHPPRLPSRGRCHLHWQQPHPPSPLGPSPPSPSTSSPPLAPRPPAPLSAVAASGCPRPRGPPPPPAVHVRIAHGCTLLPPALGRNRAHASQQHDDQQGLLPVLACVCGGGGAAGRVGVLPSRANRQQGVLFTLLGRCKGCHPRSWRGGSQALPQQSPRLVSGMFDARPNTLPASNNCPNN